jgi:hypothetical protein
MNTIIPWYKQKTTWTAVAGLFTAVGAYIAGEVSLMALISSGFGAFIVIFGRQGIEKSTYMPGIKDRGEELTNNER